MFNPRRRLPPHQRSHSLRVETLERRELFAASFGVEQPQIDLSPQEQLMVELVNRARANPAVEVARLGIELNKQLPPATLSAQAKPPLVPRDELIRAAVLHTSDMLSRDYFRHASPDGSTPSSRARAAGYGGGAAENIALLFAVSDEAERSVVASHELLMKSAGHRQNLLADSAQDLGVGIRSGEYRSSDWGSSNAMVTTQMFGNASAGPSLTGVAYSDALVTDHFFSLGEELAGIVIEAADELGSRYSTRTGTSGGYALTVPAGTYTVTATDPVTMRTADLGSVHLGSENVKVDVRGDQFDQQSNNRNDCNGDGLVTAQDILAIINFLSRHEQGYQANLDANRDNRVTAGDVIHVINALTRSRNGLPAPERSPQADSTTSGPADDGAVPTPSPPDPSPAPMDWRLDKLTQQARQSLAEAIAVPETDVVVEVARPVDWPDGNLGLPGIASQAITPGYQVILRYRTAIFEYQAALDGAAVYAGQESVRQHATGFCCPWETLDAGCLQAIDDAIDALTAESARPRS